MRYHLRAWRKMLFEGKNGPILKMPFNELCTLLGEAIKSVSSAKVIKTFKQTLLSLPLDGSRDQAEGSNKLLRYIAEVPSIDEIPEKYKLHVNFRINIPHCDGVEVDAYEIQRRTAETAEKYKDWVFKCTICGWAYFNKYVPKFEKHAEECSAFWIFNDWKPQTLESLESV